MTHLLVHKVHKVEPSVLKVHKVKYSPVSWISLSTGYRRVGFWASVSDFGVFIKLFSCLCHFVGVGEEKVYFCRVDLKMKEDEN